MSDAQRLLDAGSARERALLEAGAAELPSAESVRAAARLVGILPETALAALAVRSLLKSTRWWVVAAAVGPAVGIGAATWVAFGHASRTAAAHVAPSVAPPAPLLAAPAALLAPSPKAAEPASTAAAARDDDGRDRGALGSPAERRAGLSASKIEATPHRAPKRLAADAPDPAAGDASALHEQLALVDRARELSRAGDPNGALRLLDDYDRRFPSGLLSEETALLRIDCAAARGERDRAASLARRFLADHPASVHADRVRAMLQPRGAL